MKFEITPVIAFNTNKFVMPATDGCGGFIHVPWGMRAKSFIFICIVLKLSKQK
jgi:hypothetical protein